MTELEKRYYIKSMAELDIGTTQGTIPHKIIVDKYNSIEPLPVGYKLKYTDPWCAAYVSQLFCESIPELRFPYECSCERMRLEAEKMGIWVEDDDYRPDVGDIVLYDWEDSGIGDNKGYPDHVGLISLVLNNTLTVIEGNLGGKVGIRSLPINGKFIRGFITPKYTDDKTDENDENEEEIKCWVHNAFPALLVDNWDEKVNLSYMELFRILHKLAHLY